jgi:hypothetical protein
MAMPQKPPCCARPCAGIAFAFVFAAAAALGGCGGGSALEGAPLAAGAAVPAVVDTHERPGKAWADYSEAPIARNFPADGVYKLQSGRHWQRIAEDAARSLWAEIQRRGRCGAGAPPCPAIYLEPAKGESSFSRAFGNAFLTALVEAGAPMEKNAQAPLHVAVDAQTARFADNRPQYRLGGAARELGPGIWALADVAIAPGEGHPATGDSNSIAYTWARTGLASGKTPDIELILSLSVSGQADYVARLTRVYYVADGDAALYGDAPGAGSPDAAPRPRPQSATIELEK